MSIRTLALLSSLLLAGAAAAADPAPSGAAETTAQGVAEAAAEPEAVQPAAVPVEESGDVPGVGPAAPDAPVAEAESVEEEMQAAAPAAPAADEVPAATSAGEVLGEASGPAEVRTRARGHMVVLGPVAVDEEGRRGRIHTVARGDTLWDISEAYLGTPWVWPSVWNENHDIANPHLILPGDRIWITSTEMRRVTAAEAEKMIAAESLLSEEPEPAISPADTGPTVVEEGEFASMEQLPVTVPLGEGGATETGRTIRVSWRDALSFVSSEAVRGAATIVDSPIERTWLAEGDTVFLGLGEGEVEVGDEFTVFRDAKEVRDPERRVLLGFHVGVLGWLRVTDVRGETAVGRIMVSTSEIQRGDRITPREPLAPEVAVKQSPDGLDGRIVFLPDDRTMMGTIDTVYINRGAIHGLEVGSELEVFDAGDLVDDPVRRTTVETPDWAVADLVVVRTQPDSAVAVVTHAQRELHIGDTIRGITPRLAVR